jgi:hypothetical protein
MQLASHSRRAAVLGVLLLASTLIAGCTSTLGHASGSGVPLAGGGQSQSGGSSISWGPRVSITGGLIRSFDCPKAKLCLAGDTSGDLYLFNGSDWSGPTSLGPFSILNIGCAPPSCFATDSTGDVYTGELPPYYGWGSAVNADSPEALTALSCPTSEGCFMGDYDGNILWSDAGSPSTNVFGGTTVSSISCPSPSSCVATDTAGNYSTYDSSSWSAPSPIVGGAVGQISCPTPSFCVGISGTGLEEFNGSSWTSMSISDGADIASLSCPATSYCMAGYQGGDVATFNGTSWSTPEPVDSSIPSVEALISHVSCFAASSCTVVELVSKPGGGTSAYSSTTG